MWLAQLESPMSLAVWSSWFVGLLFACYFQLSHAAEMAPIHTPTYTHTHTRIYRERQPPTPAAHVPVESNKIKIENTKDL